MRLITSMKDNLIDINFLVNGVHTIVPTTLYNEHTPDPYVKYYRFKFDYGGYKIISKAVAHLE